MKKNSKNAQEIKAPGIPETTIGFDISDKTLSYCELNAAGEVVEEGELKLTRAALRKYLSVQAKGALIAMETGSQSAWIREEVEAAGHMALVGNAREMKLVTGRANRSDQRDAEQIARVARMDPKLMNPVELRRTTEQADLFVIRARAVLVEARTMLTNFARAITKAMGHRLPSGASHCFSERVREAVPTVLEPALLPLLEVLETLSAQIDAYDEKIEHLAAERYPQTGWLKQVPGIGTLTALTFVLTVGDPARFAHSRDAGAFLGLVPRRKQSGEQDPHLGITKCGDRYLRKLMTQCAHVVMGRYGKDCSLRRWALEHAKASRSAKKRTVVAVARKLTVLLHRLWSRQEVYRAFPAESQAAPNAA